MGIIISSSRNGIVTCEWEELNEMPSVYRPLLYTEAELLHVNGRN